LIRKISGLSYECRLECGIKKRKTESEKFACTKQLTARDEGRRKVNDSRLISTKTGQARVFDSGSRARSTEWRDFVIFDYRVLISRSVWPFFSCWIL